MKKLSLYLLASLFVMAFASCEKSLILIPDEENAELTTRTLPGDEPVDPTTPGIDPGRPEGPPGGPGAPSTAWTYIGNGTYTYTFITSDRKVDHSFTVNATLERNSDNLSIKNITVTHTGVRDEPTNISILQASFVDYVLAYSIQIIYFERDVPKTEIANVITFVQPYSFTIPQ